MKPRVDAGCLARLCRETALAISSGAGHSLLLCVSGRDIPGVRLHPAIGMLVFGRINSIVRLTAATESGIHNLIGVA